MDELSFSQGADASRSSSPSTPPPVRDEDECVVWMVNGRGRLSMQVSPDLGSPIVTQLQYMAFVHNGGVDADSVHCSVIRSASGNRACCSRKIDFILSEIQSGLVSPWEEFLLPRKPTKKFFDIDFRLPDAEFFSMQDETQDYLQRLADHLNDKCGWSAAVDSYTVMQCIYPSDPTKLSLHVVLGDDEHFENPQAQLEFMQLKGVEFDRFGIDKNVYSSSAKRLRGINGCKWDESGLSPPFFLRGVRNEHFSRGDLLKCLVQFVPTESRLIQQAQAPAVPSQLNRHIHAPREQISNDGTNPAVISTVRDICRRLRKEFDGVRGEAYRFSVEFKGRLRYYVFYLPPDYFADRDVRVVIDPQCRTYRVECPENSRFKTLELAYDEEAEQYLKQENYLKFLMDHKLARVDYPIFDIDAPGVRDHSMISTIGRFGYDNFEFFKELRETVKKYRRNFPGRLPCKGCDWCLSDSDFANDIVPPQRVSFMIANQLLDVNFFNFLRDRHAAELSTVSSRILFAYVELFVGFCVPAESWIVRTLDGLSHISVSSLKEQYFGPLQYFVSVSKGKGENQHFVYVAKPFWKYVQENDNRLKFERVASGRFLIGPDFPLNFARPMDIDVNYCLAKWQELRRTSPADASMLIGIWRNYLKLAVFNERTDSASAGDIDKQEEHRNAVADQLCRWTCEVIFGFGNRVGVMPVFVSQGGGQGKSTLGIIVCQAVGPKNYTTADPKTALGRFNDSYNGFVFFDEIHINKEVSEQLKSAVTMPTIRMEAKFKKPVQVSNQRNFFATVNNTTKLEFINSSNERRSMVLIFPEKQMIQDDGVLSYECQHCSKIPDQFGLAYCEHDILNHSELFAKIYTKILRQTDQGDMKGDLFYELIGALYQTYVHSRKSGAWSGSLQQQLIVTAGTRALQVASDTRAARWLDSCVETGFHWSPVIPPGRFGIRVTHLTDDIPRLSQTEAAPVWELRVTRDALYCHFKDWCSANGEQVQRANEFLSDLVSLSQQRRGRPLEIVKDKGRTLEWVKPHNTDKGNWIPQTDAEQDTVVILMGALRENEREPLGVVQKTALRTASRDEWRRKQIAGSTVVRQASLNRSSSNLQTQHEPVIERAVSPVPRVLEYDDTRLAALLVNEENPPRPVRFSGDRNLSDVLAALHDDDAQQPLFVPDRVRRQRDEDVDEAEQDRLALIADKRARKKQREAERSGFVDAAAIEVDDDEADPSSEINYLASE